MNYRLYRTSATGVDEWRYAMEGEMGDSPEQAEVLMSSLVTPNFPLHIFSHQFGAVVSSFDADATVIPGTKRYGENEQGDFVLCLEWQGSYYNLFVTGYPPFVVQGFQYYGSHYSIMVDWQEVASIETVQKQAAENVSVEHDHMLQLQVDNQYEPLAEIFAAIPVLVFAPMTSITVGNIQSLAPREEGIKFSPAVKKALKFCLAAHKNQVDKSGLPYALHPIHIAEQMKTESAMVVALLHDVVEDTDYTLEDLRDAGFSPYVLEALTLLTHDKSVPYLEYIKAIKFNALARAVKLADLRHNSDLTRLDIVDQKAMERVKRYAQAIEILRPRPIDTKGLYQRCFMMSAHQRIIELSHLPFEPGYYVTEGDAVLKVEGYSIYRLEVDIWVQAQDLFSLWYDSMTNFADIPASIVKELGLEDIAYPTTT